MSKLDDFTMSHLKKWLSLNFNEDERDEAFNRMINWCETHDEDEVEYAFIHGWAKLEELTRVANIN